MNVKKVKKYELSGVLRSAATVLVSVWSFFLLSMCEDMVPKGQHHVSDVSGFNVF